MSIARVYEWPSDAKTLRQHQALVGEIRDDIRDHVRRMEYALFAHRGVGLAAIQLGVPLRMFIVEASIAVGAKMTVGTVATVLRPERNDPPFAFLDPEIVWTSEEVEKAQEGCLSFPEIFLHVERPKGVRIRARNLDDVVFTFEPASSFAARVIQHEYDHLEGKLLIDHVSPLKREMVRKKLRR